MFNHVTNQKLRNVIFCERGALAWVLALVQTLMQEKRRSKLDPGSLFSIWFSQSPGVPSFFVTSTLYPLLPNPHDLIANALNSIGYCWCQCSGDWRLYCLWRLSPWMQAAEGAEIRWPYQGSLEMPKPQASAGSSSPAMWVSQLGLTMSNPRLWLGKFQSLSD